MAEGGQLSLISSFKEQFDNQLTCSVCLDQYTNPKTLPCLHSFCLHCIEQLPEEIKDEKYYISCPTCRVDHLLPQGGANNLPNSFHINSFLDLRQNFVTTKLPHPCTQSTCPQHNDLLTVYCETCCQIICRDCTISTEHNEHTFYLISECYPKYHQQILGSLDLIKHKLADMDTAMTRLDTRVREVVEKGENVKEQINAHAQQLIDNIQQSRTHLTQQVDTIVHQKTQTFATQRQQAQKLHTQLKTCQDIIEHNLKEWNQQQILMQKTVMDEMNTATEHVDPAVFQPIEDANIQFIKTGKEMGSITGIAYGNATLEVSSCTAKQSSTATLTLHSQDGSPFSLPSSLITCTFFSPANYNNHYVKCPITTPQTLSGKYNISFTPSTRNDQLIVQVGGVDVSDSPFTLPVIQTPEMRWEPVNIITGLKLPWGIAVRDNGDIVVAETGEHCITILNKKGEKVKTIQQFNYPRGVAISMDGHILVTDCHRLQKLTTDGVCVKSVGSGKIGRGQLQFNSPVCVAVHPTTGQVFVADYDNNRIQVFSNDLTFSHTISHTRLSLSPQFDRPCDIALDNEGYLYVIDCGTPCIFKLSGSNGKCMKRFSFPPGQKGSLPACLTVHNNLVYLCVYLYPEYEYNTVFVFDTQGNFQHSLGGDTMVNYPQSMSTDVLGNLYIGSNTFDKIIVI